MYLGQHWASDIFMGAFVGSFYGQRIVSYAHAHPTNKVDHFFLGPATPGLNVVPRRGGLTVSYGVVF
jgi:membrane-associated phospholipid phosphatase